MKNLKVLFTFVIILITLFLSSCNNNDNPTLQIEKVTNNWFYQVGQQRVISYAENPLDITEPSEGENMIWDFSNAITMANSKDTISIVNPQELTFVDSFPQANLAAVRTRFGSNILYKSTSDSIVVIGSYIDSFSLVLKYEKDPNIIHVAPFNFGDIINDNSIVYGDLPEVEKKQSKIIEFAGTGTVITPEKTFENCIMHKQSYFNHMGELTGISYSFYQGSFINQVASYQLNYNITPIAPGFSWGSKI